ncbi:hypothetical protein FD755_015886 [Muntiacus reevesi]|uniref:Calponin-homology (CH) domain-containing protein n=1 Tax=Muntiacus reevesi TaxID=9886 RepID=A0A5N3XFR3_MUNRE|nr:hypothetical protein FD755_015886 [Muntiacus reevesi]
MKTELWFNLRRVINQVIVLFVQSVITLLIIPSCRKFLCPWEDINMYQRFAVTAGLPGKKILYTEHGIGGKSLTAYYLFIAEFHLNSQRIRPRVLVSMNRMLYFKVELALTGSGLPVLLQFDPGRVLTFAPCFMGGHSEIHCVMQNRSKSLPLMYHFKKTAHFKVDPQKGKIDEGCMQNVTCSFIPHQVGVFKVKQFIEIIGSVADENLQSSSLKPFHQIYLYFNSVCKPSTKKVVMKINPGLSPLVSNPTGQFVVKDLVQYKDHAPVAMLQSTITHIHNHKIKKELKKGALIAFPNDRAASIRSGEDDKNFRTIFTKIPRYNYVDPDFAYTKFEKIEKKSHEKYYAGYIKYLRNVRLQKEAHRKCIYSYNDIDIGLHPASGLKSPTVSEVEMEEELSPAQCWIKHNQLLCTRNIAFKETKSLRRKVLKGLKSHPSTPHEKHDCSLILTPKQIYQVIVGPSVLNFGDVCVNSTNTHLLHIINMLPIHILIQLDVSLEELQKTNQFSYVIPPTTSTSISMIFESPTIGKFWKSFAFTVNNMPGGHILVMAVVLPVRLELSSNELILRPQGFLEKSCFRGTVRMYNHQNYFVKFKWQPINTGKGMAFSIRPAKGTVEPYSSLECEVTWQPGFDSPERGEFILHVTEGNTLTLKCLAHLGHSKVTFLEPRILFSNSPQGLTTWRKAILHNVGQNHAYFKICDQNLLSMIKIVPSQGIIPLGGLTVLNISCTPTVKEKFDTRAKVAIRRANDIDLRIGGSVEVADIEIHPNRFNFSGTYIGATHIMPFLVKNKGITRARVEFNMEDADGFSLDFEGKTVLRAPLTLSSTYFIFEIPLHTLDPNGGVTKTQNLVLHNTSRKDVEWKLDIRNTDKLFKDGIFKFSTLSGALQPNEECNVAVNFCPKQPGEYTADIPMRLNDNPICYRMLHLLGEIKSPKLLFVPPFIFFNPVPLDVPAVMDVNILPQNYFRNSTLSVRISPAKLLDGNEIQPLSVSFPKGRVIVGSSFGINASLPCRLSFKSSKSVSLFTHFSPRFFPYLKLHFNLKRSSKYEMPNKGNRFMKKEAKDKEFFSPKEGTRTYDFFLKTINAVQTWFSLFGWPEGPHSLRIPETVRRDVYKIQVYSSALSAKKFSRQSDFSKYNKTIYDVLVHLCGKMPPGINSSQSLPVDYPERVIQLHCQHSLLLEFLSAQGACISHVLPEFLLEPEDYKKWIEIASSTSASAKLSHIPKGKHSVVIDMIHFEAWSKCSWTDVFLQIYKVLVLSRVVPYSINNLPPIHVQNSPKVNAYFASSNIYSTPERILLSWMNTIYENYRHVIWKNCQKEQLKSSYFYSINERFDCYLFQIESHFIHMYTQPKSSEQYLHNCLIVVNVLREIGFDMAIQAADICDPNPILMLMFCVYMYERLPTYLPKKVVPFHCTLHDTVFREIQLKNPSLKSLVYTATIVGRDASDFSLSQAGNTVTISAKNQITITLKFTSRFLHPAEASLLLISRPKKGIGGTTMTFALKGEVLNFKAIAAIKCKSPCYTWQEITVKVKNPFQWVAMPSSTEFSSPRDQTSIKSNFIKEFFCSTHTLHLAARGTSSLELIFLPFGMHTRYCVIILSNREIGELIYILEGRGIIPLPSRFIPMDSSTPLEFGSSPEEVLTKDDPVLYLKCKLQQILDVDLKLPLTNEAKEKALAFAAQQQMSKIEYERRLLTGTLESSSIRVAIALLGLTKIEVGMDKRGRAEISLSFKILILKVPSPYVVLDTFFPKYIEGRWYTLDNEILNTEKIRAGDIEYLSIKGDSLESMKHVTVVSCQLNSSMSKEMNKFNHLRDFFPHIWSLSLTLCQILVLKFTEICQPVFIKEWLSLAHFSIGLLGFFLLLSCLSCLYILEIKPLPSVLNFINFFFPIEMIMRSEIPVSNAKWSGSCVHDKLGYHGSCLTYFSMWLKIGTTYSSLTLLLLSPQPLNNRNLFYQPCYRYLLSQNLFLGSFFSIIYHSSVFSESSSSFTFGSQIDKSRAIFPQIQNECIIISIFLPIFTKIKCIIVMPKLSFSMRKTVKFTSVHLSPRIHQEYTFRQKAPWKAQQLGARVWGVWSDPRARAAVEHGEMDGGDMREEIVVGTTTNLHTSCTSCRLNPHNRLGRLCVYGIYKRTMRAPTKENTLVLIAVDIGGKNTQDCQFYWHYEI